MPYALFWHEARLSNAYPTEAEVWEHAQQSGLVVESPGRNEATPRLEFENDYEIRPCPPDHPEQTSEAGRTGVEWRTETDVPFWGG